MKNNAQIQRDYKQRMREAGLIPVTLWIEGGEAERLAFKTEHDKSKTVPDLRKKAP